MFSQTKGSLVGEKSVRIQLDYNEFLSYKTRNNIKFIGSGVSLHQRTWVFNLLVQQKDTRLSKVMKHWSLSLFSVFFVFLKGVWLTCIFLFPLSLVLSLLQGVTPSSPASATEAGNDRWSQSLGIVFLCLLLSLPSFDLNQTQLIFLISIMHYWSPFQYLILCQRHQTWSLSCFKHLSSFYPWLQVSCLQSSWLQHQ